MKRDVPFQSAPDLSGRIPINRDVKRENHWFIGTLVD